MALPVGALGTGVNVAEVYERGGQRPLFKVPAVSQLEWGRTLDGISRATIQCTPDTATGLGMDWRSPECAGLLSSIHPWAHELVIFRDGSRVWEGPIRRPSQNRGGVTITASDVLGWGERRVQGAARIVEGVSVRDEASSVIDAMFSSEDYGILDHVTPLGSDTQVTNVDIKAVSGSYYAALASLVNAGLYFTVVGRRIILWADSTFVLGTTPILNPTRHLVGDIETAREGDELASQVWMVNDQSEYSAYGGSSDFYGFIERSVSATGIGNASIALFDAAHAFYKLHYPAPESLTVPDGSTLHCDAPFPIESLVPGVLTQVKVSDLTWPVEQTMMLTGLKVTQDAGGEKVGVTYAPVTGEEVTG